MGETAAIDEAPGKQRNHRRGQADRQTQHTHLNLSAKSFEQLFVFYDMMLVTTQANT